MYRLWIGADEGSLQRGPIYPTLAEALAHGSRFAATYLVRIETSPGRWHVFEETATIDLGPGYDPAAAFEPEPEPQPEPRPRRRERRRSVRKAAPLPLDRTESVTWNRRPVRLMDVSWTGAKIETRPHAQPHAGDVLVVEVRAFGLVAHLAGQVRWARDGECGLDFDEDLMSRLSSALLELMLGPPDWT